MHHDAQFATGIDPEIPPALQTRGRGPAFAYSAAAARAA